ncbi:hypothetical protein Krad_2586 [Kineococcus radiotolerans SRS30216 = ATCC BAA-149]|uniref:Uncharacterized protein n=1 Tax=Kineococcus radiotolerans (strain ATCC BAA-149 / DSM 14245 / SRS30216) TaxID=266940 RepID=A6WB71_KINRD|nr:hypothetical protein Krad_2586 [Kineococcus radiotolerans SRS30216 = ATCC BAA-149]
MTQVGASGPPSWPQQATSSSAALSTQRFRTGPLSGGPLTRVPARSAIASEATAVPAGIETVTEDPIPLGGGVVVLPCGSTEAGSNSTAAAPTARSAASRAGLTLPAGLLEQHRSSGAPCRHRPQPRPAHPGRSRLRLRARP